MSHQSLDSSDVFADDHAVVSPSRCQSSALASTWAGPPCLWGLAALARLLFERAGIHVLIRIAAREDHFRL